MTSATLPTVRVGDDARRFWLLIHGGVIHPVSWDDGERLLELDSAVRAGVLAPQAFVFHPRGAAEVDQQVSIQVDAQTPLQLLSQYERPTSAAASHWFG